MAGRGQGKTQALPSVLRGQVVAPVSQGAPRPHATAQAQDDFRRQQQYHRQQVAQKVVGWINVFQRYTHRERQLFHSFLY